MIDLDNYSLQLSTIFDQHKVCLAYLFGSHAEGNVRPDSDLDIAVLLESSVPTECQSALHFALMRALNRDDIDLVILNEAPNLLACAVLCHGVIIYNTANLCRIRYQARILQEYRDLTPMRRLFRKAFANRIKRGKFGERGEFIRPFPSQKKTAPETNTNMTIDQEIIHARLQAIEDYTTVLRRYQAMEFDEIVADTGTAWAIEHGLQLSIQCAIDICDHLVAELNLGTPTTHREAIELLAENGVLSQDLGNALARMFSFRNILVHAYLRVDLNIVHEILQMGLDDFARFSEQVLGFLERNEGSA